MMSRFAYESKSAAAARRLRHRHAHRPDIAVRIFEDHVTPSVWKILWWLEDFHSRCLRSLARGIRIDSHDPQFRSGSARAADFQAFEKRVLVVSVVRMQHEIHALQIQRCEILIRVAHGGAEHVFVKGK